MSNNTDSDHSNYIYNNTHNTHNDVQNDVHNDVQNDVHSNDDDSNSNNDDYIDINKLNVDIIDKTSKFCLQSIYQIQANKDSDTCHIMHVGDFEKIPNIMVNKYDIDPTLKCILVSSLFNIDELKKIGKTGQFNLTQLIINYNNGRAVTPIGCLKFNFNTFFHIQKKQSILNYLSSSDKKSPVKGFFTLSFHYTGANGKNRKGCLKTYVTYPGHKKMIEDMIIHSKNGHVMNIIKKIY